MAQLENRWEQERRMRSMMEESRLPVAERSKAIQKRLMDETRRMQERAAKERVLQVQRREREMVEALSSVRMGVARVAGAARLWLADQGFVARGVTNEVVVERVLWEMVREEDVAGQVAEVLDCWRRWVDNGGMAEAQFVFIRERKTAFAYAACVLAVVGEAEGEGSVVSDLLECLRVWKRVRLG